MKNLIILYLFKKMIRQNAEGMKPTLERAAELETFPIGYDFEKILHSQKAAMTERTKCETSHINQEQVNKGGLIYAESSRSKLKYCVYRAAYTVTVLIKTGWYDDATYLKEKLQIIPTFYPIKESVCQNL